MYFRPDSHRQHPSFMSTAEQKTSGQCVLLCSSFRILFILAAVRARARISHYIHGGQTHSAGGEIFIYSCARLSHTPKRRKRLPVLREMCMRAISPKEILSGAAAGATHAEHKNTLRHTGFACGWIASSRFHGRAAFGKRQTRSARVSRMKGNVICNVRPRCAALCIYVLICMKCGYPTSNMT
jgi:hypothetical protein